MIKCMCTMTLTLDIEGQVHILFNMADYVDAHVKINSLRPNIHGIL